MFEHGVLIENPQDGPGFVYMTLLGKNVVARNEHCVCASVDIDIVSGSADILADTTLYNEIQRTRYCYFNDLPAFSLRL